MDRDVFEAQCKEQGYGAATEGRMEASVKNADHTHEFSAMLLVLDGEITIGRDGGAQTYRAGDSCTMSAGTVHSEDVGPDGVRYLAGRK